MGWGLGSDTCTPTALVCSPANFFFGFLSLKFHFSPYPFPPTLILSYLRFIGKDQSFKNQLVFRGGHGTIELYRCSDD